MRVFIVLLALGSLVLAGCAGFGPNAPETANERFYQGTQGMDARFDYVPNSLFFYTDPGPAGNSFEVSVEARNRGASWARGAVFLSGYDPSLIRFDQVPIQGSGQYGTCGLSFGSIGSGTFSGQFSCSDFAVGANSFGDFFVDMPSFQNFASNMGWDTGNVDFSISAQQVADHTSFAIDFTDMSAMDREYWAHGRLLVGLFSQVDFTRLLGQEYVLPGRSYEYPDGASEYFTYDGEVLSSGWPPGLDEVRQTLLLTNCYVYSTYAAPLVCIDSSPQSGQEKVCRARQHSFSGSQGAPVAITSIEHESAARSSVFRIQIQNVGNGEVFDPGQIQKCSPYNGDRVRPQDKDVVYVGDVRIGNTRLINCVPDGGRVRLQNGRGTITCTYPYEYAGAGLQSGYETPLYVELWYGYSETERRDILVKRVS